MTQVLEMIFRTGENRDFRITLDNPRLGVTSAEIQSAMNLILARNVFSIEGGLAAVLEANLISTQIQPVTFS